MLDSSMRSSSASRLAPMFLLLAALSAVSAAAAEAPAPEDTMERVRGMGARRENTAGERTLLAFIVSEAAKRSLQVDSIPLADYSDFHSFSRIVEVRIPGTGSGTLALVFPVSDGFEWGDGAEGIGAALELWDRFSRSPPPVSLRFAFLGADEDLSGSRAYATYCADETSLAVLRVELGDRPSPDAELFIGGKGVLSPYWLLESAVRAARTTGFRDVLRANRSMIQRLGMTDEESPLDPWFRKGIPAITLRAGKPEAVPSPGAPDAAALVENLTRSLEAGIPDRWDRQYVLFEAFGARIAVRETRYVKIVLGLYALLGLVFVLDSLKRRDAISLEIARLPKTAAALGIVFVAVYLCSLAAGAVQSLILLLAGSPDFWKIHPAAFSTLRLGELLALFLALASLFARMGLLPRRAEFFRGGAVFVLALDVLLVSAIRVSLSLLFLWALIAAMLGRRLSRAVGRPWPAALSLPVALVPLGLLVGDLILSPEFAAYRRFLFPDLAGTAYFGFLSVPFLMLFVGLGEGIFGSGFYKARTATIGAAAFLILALGGGVWLVADARAFPGPTEIRLREYADQAERTLRVEASALRPLPDFGLARDGERREFSPGRRAAAFPFGTPDEMLGISVRREAFLDRAQLNLSIRTAAPPDRIVVSIPEFAYGSVFDSSFPFRATRDGKGVEIFIGARPPNPVVLSLTVSGEFSARAVVTAEYGRGVRPFEADGPVSILGDSAEYRTVVDLGGGR